MYTTRETFKDLPKKATQTHIDPRSKVVKGRSMTIKEIYKRHQEGINIKQREELYDEDITFDSISYSDIVKMDIEEQRAYFELRKNELSKLEDHNNKDRKKKELEELKAKVKAELEQEALEVKGDEPPVN